MSLSDREKAMLLDHATGETLQATSARYGVSYQRVQNVVREGRQFIDRLELELLKNTKTDDLVVYVVPYGPDYQLAIDFNDWVVAELRKRDVQVKIHHRKNADGVIFALEDVTPYKGRRSS
jgi:hypothetical protein